MGQRTDGGHEPPQDDQISRKVLLGTDPQLRWGRRLYRLLPSQPRCKLCASPFHAPFGPLMRAMGKGPWPKNPKYCGACFSQLVTYRAGAEIECSLLFADVRGSTGLAEQLGPAQFRALMSRFFETAAKVLVEHDAIVDKFVGDEAIGIFVPALTGAGHAEHAIKAGQALLTATGNDSGRPWLPVGAGVNSGIAFVGAVGDGEHVELTALGDTVNVAARLASAAGAGELLVARSAAAAARLPIEQLERRELMLRGKSAPTETVVLRAT